ncbi:hypothetical protein N7453_005446 [Penicillium expansum]|nr:hypothetical protein N7453_005446 [Penicillium expansum]
MARPKKRHHSRETFLQFPVEITIFYRAIYRGQGIRPLEPGRRDFNILERLFPDASFERGLLDFKDGRSAGLLDFLSHCHRLFQIIFVDVLLLDSIVGGVENLLEDEGEGSCISIDMGKQQVQFVPRRTGYVARQLAHGRHAWGLGVIGCARPVRISPIVVHEVLGEFVEIAHVAILGGTARGDGFVNTRVPFQFVYVVVVQKLVGSSFVVGQYVGDQAQAPEEKQIEHLHFVWCIS